MGSLVERVRRHRTAYAVMFDSASLVLAYVACTWLRLESTFFELPWREIGAVAAVNVALFLAVGAVTRFHQGRARIASLEEMLLLGTLLGGSGFVVFVANLFGQWISRSVPVAATLGALVISAWARATWRRLGERDDERAGEDAGRRVLVVGGGAAGRDLISSMIRDPQGTWQPVGLLDDDPHKRHLRIRGVPVVGTTRQLAEQAERLGVQTVVIALPSASAKVINRLRVAAMEADLAVKVLPATSQLLRDHVGIRDLRDINLTDVLGRKQLDTDVRAIAGYLEGRRVLVTGAGGSIGAELCRQIHRYRPAELMMLDRDESALHGIQLTLHGRALLDGDEVILADIRDRAAVDAIFERRRPEVVFHAAALKHLPMLEQYPVEAVKTNVCGTGNLLEAAERVGVERFVNISTDKAANPCSVLGRSKRIAEMLTADHARRADGTFLSVRFGNVLGSRGSVLTSFASQIAAGGAVTVTHPDVTRYFMTIEEACELVVQAAAIGAPGEALVLDMGPPVRIADVARQLIEQSGAPVDIVYTGLRDGEKLHEELFGDGEPTHVRPAHPLISHVPVPPVSRAELPALLAVGDNDALRRALASLCAPERDYSEPR